MSLGLLPQELQAIRGVLQKHAAVVRALVYGSRAKGNARPNSDIDLALYGDLDAFAAERIALEMDELPMPYEFDVIAMSAVKNAALRKHIERVGIEIFPAWSTPESNVT